MKTITQTNATIGQIKQITRVGCDAIEKALAELNLDNPSAQRAIEHGDKFAEAIRIAAVTSLKNLSTSDKFNDEEVKTTYGYVSGYKPKELAEQIRRLKELFPRIGHANMQIADGALPPNAEGWFAIPRWESIAPTYYKALYRVFDLLKETRFNKYHNYLIGKISGQLRPLPSAEAIWKRIEKQQAGYDILIVPAQFGLLHQGRSTRRAGEVMRANEIGLKMFDVGIMLLTHPERLMTDGDLDVMCAGEYITGHKHIGNDSSLTPVFRINGDWVEVFSRDARSCRPEISTASAFLI